VDALAPPALLGPADLDGWAVADLLRRLEADELVDADERTDDHNQDGAAVDA
jgi:hypothetical protein